MTDIPKTDEITEITKGETVPISSLDNFVKLLTGWHMNKVQTLRHMMEIPEGSEMTTGEDGAVLKLTGEALAGFKAGIELSLMELGTLPFSVEFEPESANDEGPASGG